MKDIITAGKTALGIEFGSTRVKAVLIDENSNPLASGAHDWENKLENGYWTYSLEDVQIAIHSCFKALKADVKEKYGCDFKTTGAIGISAMMHGYLAFDKDGNLLAPFRTWRNTTTAEAAEELTEKLGFNIPQRWTCSHIYQAILGKEDHVPEIAYVTTLAGYVHYMREIVLCALILLSLYTTSHTVRFKKNKFSWMPITEVAILFLGIFVTMTPVLEFMRAHASQMALSEPWHFYYATGALSSFLDNTPTAVVFHTLALTLSPAEMAAMDTTMVAGVPSVLLRAISLGSVMFGAMTYIGNGPNFMVKAIAERRGVKMPSFFGYMVTFSLVVLLPVYVLVQLIFL